MPVSVPRLILAAASSDAGKTTISLGLILALRRRGLRVAAAKVGPDFIDSAHLARVTQLPARNLDAWLAPEDAVRASFVRGAANCDISIIEGVMGLFDGRHGSGDGSTAHVARLLDAPVVLVLDCAKASSTVGAIAHGLATYDARVNVAGIILNRVASAAHARTVRDACERANLPVLGIVRRDERLVLPSRHLGLDSPENPHWDAAVHAAANVIAEDVDLDEVLAIARMAAPLAQMPQPLVTEPIARIAIARDEAFWFYDEGSLETLRNAGAQLVPYSPMRDPFPDVDGAFVGGGYPELHARALEENTGARTRLRGAIEAGMPVYAECGGLMYLGGALDTQAQRYAMVGAVPAVSTMSEKRSALRYLEPTVLHDGPLFRRGDAVRGHEFHYSRTAYEHDAPVYDIDGQPEGYRRENLHASYVHVHLSAYPQAAAQFVQAARAFGGAR